MSDRPTLHLNARCRVIVDNDFAGDPDGLVALAHHLLHPSNRVTVVTSSLLNQTLPGTHPTAADGAALVEVLLEVIGAEERPAVHAGSESLFDPAGFDSTLASDTIVAEARRNDPLPLYLVCGGPLTNVATALRQAPDIADRLTLVWIGGALAPDVFEYNRDTDPAAAEFVFAMPGLGIDSFPQETYRRCAYSVAELEHDLGGAGRLGAWLFEHFTHPPDWVELGGVWPLGDSPPLLITALTDTFAGPTATEPGVRRVHTEVDFRLIVADMVARLRLHELQGRRAREEDVREQPR
jgi:purine nucleosidase